MAKRFWIRGWNRPRAAALSRLRSVYRSLEEHTDRWSVKSGVSCPSGCGYCCTGFTPDVLPVEAEYLALFLIEERPDLLDRAVGKAPNQQTQCLFYDPGSSFHCTVYEARPLVCRLFAWAGTTGKTDSVKYVPCGKMLGVSAMSADAAAGKVGRVKVPVMGVYAEKVEGADTDGQRWRKLLPDALSSSLSSLLLRRQLWNAERLSRNRVNPGGTDVTKGA